MRTFDIVLGRRIRQRPSSIFLQCAFIASWNASLFLLSAIVSNWLSVRASQFWFKHGLSKWYLIDPSNSAATTVGVPNSPVKTILLLSAFLIALLVAEGAIGWIGYRTFNPRSRA